MVVYAYTWMDASINPIGAHNWNDSEKKGQRASVKTGWLNARTFGFVLRLYL